METTRKVYKDGYLEKCELKEDEYGFYLDLHFAGIDGEDKDLYIPKVRLGFNRNVAPVIIEDPNDGYCKVELGAGHRYFIEEANCKVVAKTGKVLPFKNTRYVEVMSEKDDIYTFDEIARAFDMISAVLLKEFLSKAKKSKEDVKTEKEKSCLTCKWFSQSQHRNTPCPTCSPSHSNWEGK